MEFKNTNVAVTPRSWDLEAAWTGSTEYVHHLPQLRLDSTELVIQQDSADSGCHQC